MRTSRLKGIWILAACLIAAASSSTAQAQSVEDFFTGRQLILIVGTAAGSGYDVIGRIIAKYMGKYLPGQPKFVVQNMSGAGGITATNYINTAAPRDGSTIAVVNREAIFDPIFSGEKSKANYDPRKFVWLGTPNQEIGMAYAMTSHGIHTIEDTMQREVVAAAAGTTSGSAVFPRLLNALIGTKFKIITGYPGSMDGLLAMERGEADARVDSGWAGPETTAVNDLVRQGKAVLLLQIGVNKDARFPDIRNIMEFAKNDDQRQLMQLLFSDQILGRPFFAPPGIPPDRAAALQNAFAKTMDDPGFQHEAEEQDVALSPLYAADMLKVVEQVYDTPKPLVQRAIEMSASAMQ